MQPQPSHSTHSKQVQISRASEEEELAQSAEPENIRLENLKFVRQLGAGQSASVFEALDSNTGKHYAVKQISIADKAKRHQILKELTTLHSANCANIIHFYGAFFSQGIINILLELMNAGPLDRILSSAGRVPEAELAFLAKQMCDALLYLHEKHQVHRDIKPSNICLLVEGCRCKLRFVCNVKIAFNSSDPGNKI